jgi:hypothetical protein
MAFGTCVLSGNARNQKANWDFAIERFTPLDATVDHLNSAGRRNSKK